ncbi:MAG: hypothetical protein ACSLFH_10125 [Desulfuromonadales bacterium]
MLNLFHSIFQNTEKTQDYPKTLVNEAIERAVDGTDPWLRGLSGYQKKLRPAVLTAIDHVVTLVDSLEPPRLTSRESYDRDPLLRAMFLSSAQMRQVMHDQLAIQTVKDGVVCALLVAELELRGTSGFGQVGDILVRDVARVTASFANHRLIDPAGDEGETRHRLKRRAFDHLLSLALRRMLATREIREDLDKKHTLLQAKLDIMQRSSWGLETGGSQQPASIADLETQLAEIETQLLHVGTDDRSIEVALELLIDVLGQPQLHLWQSRETLVVDPLGIKRAVASDDAPALLLEKLHNAEGLSVVMTLVTIEQ